MININNINSELENDVLEAIKQYPSVSFTDLEHHFALNDNRFTDLMIIEGLRRLQNNGMITFYWDFETPDRELTVATKMYRVQG